MCFSLGVQQVVQYVAINADNRGVKAISEGTYNDRKISGSSWPSMHSWGIAVDMDPDHNGLKVHRPQERLSGTDEDAFWQFVEDEGGVSLGRGRDDDWMHFQFARL